MLAHLPKDGVQSRFEVIFRAFDGFYQIRSL
jgi:hypothetical protein